MFPGICVCDFSNFVVWPKKSYVQKIPMCWYSTHGVRFTVSFVEHGVGGAIPEFH